jgi:hypothetical protein
MHAIFDPLDYKFVAFRTCCRDIRWVQRGTAIGGKVDTMSAVTIGAHGRYVQARFIEAYSVHCVAI